MTKPQLAVEKLSPIAWWSVLATNFGAMFGLVLAAVGVYYSYQALSDGSEFWQLALRVAAAAFGFRIFLSSLVSSKPIRLARYAGTVIVLKGKRGWHVNLPRMSFRGPKLSGLLLMQFARYFEKAALKENGDRAMIFAVGFDTEADDYRLKLLHSCADDMTCERPDLHLRGYSEQRDGAIRWDAV
jgi:hypothetical protein